MLRRTFLCFALLLSSVSFPFAAEYQGQNVDGQTYDATAFSYDTGKFYNVSVEFDGDEATIFFAKGGHITLTLDDEEIDDPHSISAYDYQRGVFWDLDVDGLD
jgi:hypothetical protein